MSFTSLEFIFIFFPICVAGYYLFPKRFRNFFLLAASLIFYAAGELHRMYILIIGILINYIAGRLLAVKYKKRWIKNAVLALSDTAPQMSHFLWDFLFLLSGPFHTALMSIGI